MASKSAPHFLYNLPEMIGDPDNWTTMEAAPADVPIWMVYGPVSMPSLVCVRIKEYPPNYVKQGDPASRAVWGYSVYKRKPGFRTLGVGRAWVEEHEARFFADQADALAHLAKLTTPKL